MLRKILFTLGIAIVMGNYASAQNATIKGRVTEPDGKTAVEFATVRLMQDGHLVLGASTDDKGNYNLSPVASGKYNLVVSSVGYQTFTLEGLEIRGNVTKIQDVSLGNQDQILGGVTVTGDRPIVDMDAAESAQRISSEDIDKMAGKSLNDILSTMSGVSTSAAGTSYRGNRPGEQEYMVDGVKSSMTPPRSAWAEVALIQGAVPAEYASSATIEIETKSFSREHHGAVEATGNLNGYNNYSMNFYFSGPLVRKKDDKSVIVGYMLSGGGGYYGSGGYDIRGGTYRASQETIDYITENPLRQEGDGIDYNINYVTKYQEDEILSLEEKKGKRLQNTWSASGSIVGKLDFKAGKNVDIMLKGLVYYNTGRSLRTWGNTLFNSINNPMSEDFRWDLNARLTHRIKTDPKSKVKNVYYRLYGYYYQRNQKTYSHVHKDNLFDYGYIGKFEADEVSYYAQEQMTWDGQMRDVWVQQMTPLLTNLKFTPGGLNPGMEQYTLSSLNYSGGVFPFYENIVQNGGFRNGDYGRGTIAYSLFTAPGIPYNGYSKSMTDRINLKAAFSFDLGNHSIKFGFDFDQSIVRSHSMSPVGLWQIMRDVANSHIMERDLENPIGVYDEFGRFLDTIKYNRLNTGGQGTFATNIREKLNMSSDEYVNIDKYDPNTYSLDMFSAEELFNNGYRMDGYPTLSFYGYDYTGKTAVNKPVTMDDMKKWFTGEEGKRDFSIIGARKPIRISAYIQDNFSIKSLFFNLGLRLDVFDKNQPYVKDMFLYSDAYTLKEARQDGKFSEVIIPDFISNNAGDFYVYVAEKDDAKITAYRRGNVWYNTDGVEVTKPDDLAKDAGTTVLMPLLKQKQSSASSDAAKIHHNAFAAYTPTFKNGGISLSPRIAFMFAVGESSKFTASYNVITKNDASQSINPVNYYYFTPSTANSQRLANPGLKPEKDINYEIGFEQALNKNLKVSFNAFYSEKRDMVSVYNYSQAYPASYYSFINMDFGTTQGFIFGLTMRQVKNLSFQANYTLQFAKGTASSAESALTLISSGAPNLRTLTILEFDQRHALNLTLQYGFSAGTAYNGPVTRKEIKNTGKVREIKWLEMAGASLTFGARSGLPYTASSEAYSKDVMSTDVGQRVVQGSIYGSRMPWKFSCDLNIYKGFPLVLKDSDDPRARKMGSLTVALAIMNLLQLDDIQSVYSYTGSPTDDGFLTSSKYQQYIASQNSPTSFIDYYTIMMEGFNRLGGPRYFNLTVSFSF